MGVKGPRAAEWLEASGVALPAQPNTWLEASGAPSDDAAQPAGLLIARLGVAEYFLEEGAAAMGDESATACVVPRLCDALRTAHPGVYPVLRQDAAFLLSGDGALDVLAQVCSVDFSQLARGAQPLFMTMVIGVAVLIVPQSARGETAYRIWCDPTFAAYFGQAIGEVVVEGGGSQGRLLA